jgi:sec-independent protein translocase protein TatB
LIDLGVSKLMLIGVVALIVIGPEKLPRLARTIGNLMGRAQRYVADVKGEVSRQIELEELKKMKTTVEDAAQTIQKSVEDSAREVESNFEKNWSEATAGLTNRTSTTDATSDGVYYASHFKAKKKDWRKKQSAIPQWYKRQNGLRSRTQSGAARVARFRPAGLK